MGVKAERIIQRSAHRAVNWNEKAIQKVIDRVGHVLVGIKIDGMRAHVFFDEVKPGMLPKITTREGIEIKALEEYRPHLKEMYLGKMIRHTLCLDAEVWIPGKTFQESSGLLRRHSPLPADCIPQFVLLDMFPTAIIKDVDIEGFHIPEVAPNFAKRYGGIVRYFPKLFGTDAGAQAPVCAESLRVCKSVAEVWSAYYEARELGFEGIVVKDPDLGYVNGKVSGAWKLKPGGGAPGWEGDGVVEAYVWGEPGKANEGKLVGFRVRLDNGEVCNVTGLNRAQIKAFTDMIHHASQTETPAPFIGRIIKIEAMETTDGGSLRHPKFRGFRDMDYAQGIIA